MEHKENSHFFFLSGKLVVYLFHLSTVLGIKRKITWRNAKTVHICTVYVTPWNCPQLALERINKVSINNEIPVFFFFSPPHELSHLPNTVISSGT